MKIMNWNRWIPRLSVVIISGAISLWGFLAFGTQYSLRIEREGTNQLALEIIGAGTNTAYEIYGRQMLQEPFWWVLVDVGETNQTNFVFDLGVETIRFYQAVQDDLDGDGVFNREDAAPTNSSIGSLTVTIVAPGDGNMLE